MQSSNYLSHGFGSIVFLILTKGCSGDSLQISATTMMIFYNCNSQILFYYNIILHGKSRYLMVLQVSSLKTVHKSALYRKMVFSKMQNLTNFDFLTKNDQDMPV